MNNNQPDPMALAAALVAESADQQPRRYRLKWRGTKIPRGAKIGDVKIAWTQHGIIRGEGGEELGFYERTREWAGEMRDEHEMVVSVKAQAFGPDGQPCELLQTSVTE